MDTLLFAREEQSLEYMLLNIQLEQDWIKSTLESAFQKLPPDLVVRCILRFWKVYLQ